MPLLTPKFVLKRQVQARIYFIFLKNVLKKVEVLLIPNFDLSAKIEKVVTK